MDGFVLNLESRHDCHNDCHHAHMDTCTNDHHHGRDHTKNCKLSKRLCVCVHVRTYVCLYCLHIGLVLYHYPLAATHHLIYCRPRYIQYCTVHADLWTDIQDNTRLVQETQCNRNTILATTYAPLLRTLRTLRTFAHRGKAQSSAVVQNYGLSWMWTATTTN